jgi:predicted GTPase
MTEDFKSKFKQDIQFVDNLPPIIYVANKSEDGFEGDILADFFKMFPDPNIDDPLFISAEHGDGF